MSNLLLLLIMAAITAVLIQQRKTIMNQAELAQAISDLKADHDAKNAALVDQLNKALAEIIAAIGGNVTPELQAAFDTMKAAIASGETNAQAVAQQLDDLNPDQP